MYKKTTNNLDYVTQLIIPPDTYICNNTYNYRVQRALVDKHLSVCSPYRLHHNQLEWFDPISCEQYKGAHDQRTYWNSIEYCPGKMVQSKYSHDWIEAYATYRAAEQHLPW